MATFNELLQDYVNMDYQQLLAIAQKSLVNVMPVCQAVDPDNKGVLAATAIILSAIGADGVLTGLEKKFLADAIGLDDASIQKFIGMYDSRMVELADKLADASNAEVKANILALVICVAAVDEKISREETALIKRILA